MGSKWRNDKPRKFLGSTEVNEAKKGEGWVGYIQLRRAKMVLICTLSYSDPELLIVTVATDWLSENYVPTGRSSSGVDPKVPAATRLPTPSMSNSNFFLQSSFIAFNIQGKMSDDKGAKTLFQRFCCPKQHFRAAMVLLQNSFSAFVNVALLLASFSIVDFIVLALLSQFLKCDCCSAFVVHCSPFVPVQRFCRPKVELLYDWSSAFNFVQSFCQVFSAFGFQYRIVRFDAPISLSR